MDIGRDELLELFRRRGGELKNGLLLCPFGGELHIQPVSVPEVADEPVPGAGTHCLDADLGPARSTPDAFLDTLRADGETAVVHIPHGQRERREALEVVPGEVLLAIAKVDDLAQLT